MVKVSVIIPCYNAEKYLDQCLQSVLNQTLADIEIICVDDGSTDNTVNMLHQYAAVDPRVKVLCQQNKFAGIARNTGMDAATGEYFAFLDADDFYEQGGLEKAYAIARENDLDMLKLSSYLLDDLTGEITTNAHYSHERFVQKNRVVNFKSAPKNFLNCADVAWNGLYKAEFIRGKQLRFNNFRCVNDRSFYISCLVHADRIMVADEYLTNYRRNISGSLVSVRYKYFDCQINSYNLIRQILREAQVHADTQKLALQFELNQIFLWYEKFLASGVNTFHVEKILRDFVEGFAVADVGSDYMPRFPYKRQLLRFRESLTIRWVTEPAAGDPLVSVIIPVHNSVRFLSECLESVFLQSLSDFELICVNDGSSDASGEILRCFAEQDSRVRILEREQAGGAGVARNSAIAVAKGKYLVFVDSDDKIHKNYLQMLVTPAEEHNADVVVSPDIAWSGEGEGVPMRNHIADKRLPKNQAFSYADVPDYILNFTDGGPGGKLFRRAFVVERDIQFLPIRRSEDFNFVLGAIIRAERVFNMSTCGYYYRKNNPTSSENTKDQTPLMFWDATMHFREELMQLDYFEQIKRSYLNNTINRFYFNMKAVKTFEGFSAIFCKLKEIAYSVMELDQHEKKYFHDGDAFDALNLMLQYETPGDFLYIEYKKQLQELTQLRRYRQKTEGNATVATGPDLSKSSAYRIGSAITFIPRKVRGFIWCVKDHGLGYTIKYGWQKILRKIK